jgi:hypothetical protein
MRCGSVVTFVTPWITRRFACAATISSGWRKRSQLAFLWPAEIPGLLREPTRKRRHRPRIGPGSSRAFWSGSQGYLAMLDRRLALAGRPRAWTIDKILIAKPVFAAGLLALVWISSDPVILSIGRARKDAHQAFGERTSSPDLRRFTRSVVQADTYGISIAAALRVQATEMRLRRRQRAEERAMRIPVKVLFPLIFCILPELFVVLLTPAVLSIIKAFA